MHASDDRNSDMPRAEHSLDDVRCEDGVLGVISSDRLLSGRPCVTIDHEGTHYVLRATRAGKLILTK